MSIPSVATSIALALEPHTRNFIRSETTVRRTEVWGKGCSEFLEDETIKCVFDDLHGERDASDLCRNNVELARQEPMLAKLEYRSSW